jgi:hypothetical protein
MALNYSVTEDFKVIIKDGTKKVDEVGPFDSSEGAELWGSAVCEKYNSAEYKTIKYPNELPVIDEA